MPRGIRLPPLTQAHEMRGNDIGNNIHAAVKRHDQQQSIANSSAANIGRRIDCILVYEYDDDDDKNGTTRKKSDEKHKINLSPSERRKKFEEYLMEKQRLVLKHDMTNSKYGFVKVHTPFDILLVTAENVRMRLPIEKIDENENPSINIDSCWTRFKNWFSKPFRLDPSLFKDDPDYYTAIYSSNVNKFHYLFDTLRGSKEAYFTPSERSLLTYELLARAHFDDQADDDDDDNDNDVINKNSHQQGIQRAAFNTVVDLQKGKRRPGINRLIAKKAYVRYFPLHERIRKNFEQLPDQELNDREKLKRHWATMFKCIKFQPLSLIRSYMGEKVAFYFALTGFYNQMLILPAIIGLIIFIYGASTVYSDQPTSDICGDFGQQTYMCPRCDKTCPFWKLSDSCIYSKISYVFDNASTVAFAVFMSLWARWFVEFWKRHQAALQYEWDSIDFEGELEPVRPEYEAKAKLTGIKRVNPITETEEYFIPAKRRVPAFVIGTIVVLITVLIICGTLFGTIVYRVQMDYILKNTSAKSYSSIIITITSALINLICSLLLSQLYYWIAMKLTDLEWHKHQSKHDDSLIIKIYLFQFVNYYSSLFYIAFFKGKFLEYPSKYGETTTSDFTEQCDPAGCFFELSIQFVIIMIGKQIVNNVVEFLAAMRRTIQRSCCRKDNNDNRPQWEIDNQLYDFTSSTLIDEYLELVIQFGFVTLFVAAFPLAPLFALINNLIELRLDAWKLLSKYKRPIPFKAADIGIWSDVLSAISYLSVLTNAIVIAWTSEFIPKMTYRALSTSGSNLNGYANWTLSSFSIADYNSTGTMTPDVPNGLTYCRYSDFRESTGPNYSHTSIFWNVLAARLAFAIVFEHLIFFIVYVLQWIVSDVPKTIRNKIDHERYIDQRERWASKSTEEKFTSAAIASEAVSKMFQFPNEDSQPVTTYVDNNPETTIGVKSRSHQERYRRWAPVIRIGPTDKQ